MTYEKNTTNSPNPIARFAHRTRTRMGVDLISNKIGLRLLDYGCGDGRFLSEVSQRRENTEDLFGFEPFMATLPTLPEGIEIMTTWDTVLKKLQHRNANVVTCFEVMEHLMPSLQKQAFEKMLSIIHPDGTLVLSIPIECGFPAIIKNIFRFLKFRRYSKLVYSWHNLIRSFFGKPIPECRSGSDYLSHMGFYYWDLEDVMSEYFEVSKKMYSPFGFIGPAFNSQVFYIAKPIKL